MRNLFTVARRELRQRRGVLAAAALLGLVPVVVCAFGPDYRANARLYGVGELLAAFALAAFVGLGLIGDDLVSGRMGWYFSRPLSGVAIWGGKLGGAAALAISSTLIMTVPALLLVSPREGLFDGTPFGAAGLVVCPVMFLGAGAVGGIVARARTRWMWVDLACILAFAPVVTWASARIHARPTGGSFLGESIILTLGVAFAAGSAAGIILGRADARRAHAAASLATWGIVLPVLVGLFVYARFFI